MALRHGFEALSSAAAAQGGLLGDMRRESGELQELFREAAGEFRLDKGVAEVLSQASSPVSAKGQEASTANPAAAGGDGALRKQLVGLGPVSALASLVLRKF